MTASAKTTVRAGLMTLSDCVPLVVAERCGFAASEGLRLELVRETSWANIRDKVSVGHLDVAHMLAPMPIAQNLGLGPMPSPMITAMSLGSGENALTLSSGLIREVREASSFADGSVSARAHALAQAATARRRRRARPPLIAIVHPHSVHRHELAYWMASAGIVIDRDVRLTVVPPMLMPDAMAAGEIDGMCVGEPWGSVAVARGVGAIMVTKSEIWPGGPEKVLGARRRWAEAEPETLAAVIRAVYRAAEWCDAPGNREDLVAMLADSGILGLPPATIRPAIVLRSSPEAAADGLSPMTFALRGGTFPWESHALWIYARMVIERDLPFDPAHLELVRRTVRPDLYRAALAQLGLELPPRDTKIEGDTTGWIGAGPFFDGRIFDPAAIEAYIRSES